MERWKPIPKTDNKYYVSNKGRVKSVDGYSWDKNGRKVFRRGKFLRGSNNGQGYYKVGIIINGTKQMRYIHRIVAEVFVKNPNGYNVVNHKDFNPSNNCANNLEWTTPRGNYDYSANYGHYVRGNTWKANIKASLDNAMGKPVIGTRLTDGATLRYAALNDCKKDGFSPSCVSNCCNGKRTTHKGFAWRFENG